MQAMATDTHRAEEREHGGGLDAAISRYGGARSDWLDLSTGINPEPYPVGTVPPEAWTALPDRAAHARLVAAARAFWNVPDGADIVPAPGASALIAKMPALAPSDGAYVPVPTYNEHAAAFEAHGLSVHETPGGRDTHVYVHPNNPDGRLWQACSIGGRALTIVDESFCDVAPEASHVALAEGHGILILKSFGKFWGLAGLRLGFAIAAPSTLVPLTNLISHPATTPPRKRERAQATLQDHLGPWAVSGPALEIGTRALEDKAWAKATRARLAADANRLDALMANSGAKLVGGTSLFRLYDVADADAAKHALCTHHILTRTFSYSKTWIRLGLPPKAGWPHLERALGTAGGAMRARASAEPTGP